MDKENNKRFCDGCGFEFETYNGCWRRDKKWFCGGCQSENTKRFSTPSSDFCSYCGFNERIGNNSPLAKRIDGHYWHIDCFNRSRYYK